MRPGPGRVDFPYRNGFAAYVWVTKPDGKRTRKYVYGKSREDVHHKRSNTAGPVAAKVPTAGECVYKMEKDRLRHRKRPLTRVDQTWQNKNRLG